MDQATPPSPDDPAFTPMIARPTSAGLRLRGRLERLRLVWRRASIAAGAGLLAAGVTMVWLAGARSTADSGSGRPATRNPATADDVDGPRPPSTPSDHSALAEDQRVLALDRSAIALPVTIGSTVEVVGLRPTIDDVRAEVIAARAEVIAVTEDAVLVAVDADAAYTAAEIAAVGRVTVLGRDRPPG